MRAALIDQRATSDADQKIADALSGLVDQHREDQVKAADEASESGDGEEPDSEG